MKLNKAPIPAANPGPSFVSGVRNNRQHTTKYGSNSTIARSPKPGISIPGRKNGTTSRIPQTRSRMIKRRIEGETCSSKAFGVVGVLFICYASLRLAALLRFLRWSFFPACVQKQFVRCCAAWTTWTTAVPGLWQRQQPSGCFVPLLCIANLFRSCMDLSLRSRLQKKLHVNHV
jgi:hypothetical protein